MYWRLTCLLVIGTSLALSQDDSARQMLHHAVELQQSGRFTEAIEAYRAFLKSYPDAPGAIRSNLGAALAHEGRYSEAIEEYTQALKSDPSNAGIRLNLGLARYKTGDAVEAVREFEPVYATLPDKDPNRGRVAVLLGECYLRQGQNQRVVALLDPLASSDPNNKAVDYLLGTALLREGQTDRGAILIQRLLESGDTAEAHMLMAYTQLKANQKKQALDEVNRALQLNANLPEAYSLRGRLAYLDSDMAGAEKSFTKAVSLDPGNFDARLWLGTLQREQGSFEQAHENLNFALRLRPQDLRARFQFARLYSDQGDDNRAVTLLEALEKDSPEFIEVHRTLATIYFRVGRPDDGRRERKISEQMDGEVRKRDEARGRSLTN